MNPRGADLDFGSVTRRAGGVQAAYDAAETTNRRRTPITLLRSEDSELTSRKRKTLTATTRDVARNFAVAAWMIRKHLDFTASFNFSSRTGDDALDADIESLMNWFVRPRNCDIAGRHPLPRQIRLAEARRIVDGDMFFIKLRSGHLQAIEGDRIQSGGAAGVQESETTKFIHGVKTNRGGRALAYALWNRNGSQFKFDRMVAASRCIHHGCFERFDQVRGVSPMAAALNTLRDTYEGLDYALAKAKIGQLFALALFREDSEGINSDIDLTAGPQLLDMGAEDKAEFLTDRTPSNEFKAFIQTTIAIALKALDIPFSFYDEGYTNFFGSRAAQILYEKSAKEKRRDVLEMLRQITVWRLGLWIADGQLTLPRGMELSDIKWEWIPTGLPWWDPAKEVRGDTAAVVAGLRSRTEIRKERYGDEWKDVVDRLAEEEEYLRAKQVHVSVGNELVFGAEPVAGTGSNNDE